MIKSFLKKWAIAFVVISLLILTAAIFLYDFNTYTKYQLEQDIHSYMEEIKQQSVVTLKRNMTFLIDKLQIQARIFNLQGEMSEEKIFAELEIFAQSEEVTRASIVTPKGKVYSSEFGLREVDPAPFKAMFERSDSHISKLRTHEATGRKFIDITTPLFINDKRFGALVISYDYRNFRRIFKVGFLNGNCNIHLVTSEGDLISEIGEQVVPSQYKDNYIEFFNREDVTLLDTTLSQLKEGYSTQKSNSFKYEFEGEPYCVSYEAVGINDWLIATTLANGTLQLQAGNLERMAVLLTIKIMGIMLIALLLFAVYYVKKRKTLEWLKDSYRLALSKSNDFFYEVDLERDTYVNHSEQSDQPFLGISETKYSDFVKRYSELCPTASRQSFLNYFLPEYLKKGLQGKNAAFNFEYKVTSHEKADYWVQSMMIPMFENGHTITKVICIQNDFSTQKLKTENLQKAAKLDGATMLYNKVATEDMITNFIDHEGKYGTHALFVLDIDCFKDINDRFGHMKGDEVISKLGQILNHIFRKSDILGRIGGDEFMVLLKNYDKIELVAAKAEQINATLKEAFADDIGKGGHCKVSVSIGIALFKADGDTYNQLYKNADAALYASKHVGKDQFTFFSEMGVRY